MNSNTNNSPMLKAASLWSKTSVKGGQYLTGRWGALKVLVMENRDRKGDDDPSHVLLFTEAPDRRQGTTVTAQERSDGQRGAGTPPASQRHPQPQRSAFQGHQAPLDADLDDAPEWAR
jgi:hypothetical protein